MDAAFLDHFDRELSYLREMGSVFAERYPKLAGRLGLDEFQCADPFVERLLEGFAFLAARVHRRMDAEFPQWTRALFETIYPHYVRPIPSAGIFQLQPAQNEGSLLDGYIVPRGTRLMAAPAHGQQTGCRFDTTCDLHLWPIRLEHAHFFSRESTSHVSVPSSFHDSSIRSGLWLTFHSTVPVPPGKLCLDQLRLYLRGGDVAHCLYETLLANTVAIACSGEPTANLRPESWTPLPIDRLRPSGFGTEEALLPQDERSFSGYRLLQEYFQLPEKFLFVELDGLQPICRNMQGQQFHVLLGFTTAPSRLIERVNNEHLALHCVPAINLFPKRADRVHLDSRQHEHQIICDRSRPLDYEIWSIQSMAAHSSASQLERECLPLYGSPTESFPADSPSHDKDTLFYAIDRRSTIEGTRTSQNPRSSYMGTEVFVSLVDLQTSSSLSSYQQISSLVYCTNRDLPYLAPEGGWRQAFHTVNGGPIEKVQCLTGPTSPRLPLVRDEGETAWRLIRHLTPNYLSLVDDVGGASLLRSILQLYCEPLDAATLRQIGRIRHVQHQSIVRRVPKSGPLTFARGIEIELTMDEDHPESSEVFLLGSILEQFFARFVSVNSFAETHLISARRGSVYRWPSRMGTASRL
ncbi:MAG: type VI secretion system baseplate subunit TssF [Pirellulales bacterium]